MTLDFSRNETTDTWQSSLSKGFLTIGGCSSYCPFINHQTLRLFRDPTKTLNYFRRRGGNGVHLATKDLVDGKGVHLATKDHVDGKEVHLATRDLVDPNGIYKSRIPATRAQQHRGNSNKKKKFDSKSGNVDQMSPDGGGSLVNALQNQNSVKIHQNSGNWPLVNSGVFVNWADNTKLNSKVKQS